MLLSYSALMIDCVYISGVQLSIVDTHFINQTVDPHKIVICALQNDYQKAKLIA